MSNHEIESMETQSTMPAKVEEVEKLPALSIEVHRMEITATQLRKYFAPANATSADIGFFIAMAKSLGLNPWKREIHMVPFYDPTGARKYAAVVGYEVYLNRAEASQKLDGWKTEFDDEDNPTKCTITIWREDWSHEFTHTTYMDEVKKLKKNGEPMATWASQPRFQLKKCTIAQGMRMCIPECAGLPYTFEEQAIIQHDMVQGMPVEEPIEIESAQAEADLDQMRRDYFDALDETIKADDELRYAWQERVTKVKSVTNWEEEHFNLAMDAIEAHDYRELIDVAKEKERMEAELGQNDVDADKKVEPHGAENGEPEQAEGGITPDQISDMKSMVTQLFGSLGNKRVPDFVAKSLGKRIRICDLSEEEATKLIEDLNAELDKQADKAAGEEPQTGLPFYDSEKESSNG